MIFNIYPEVYLLLTACPTQKAVGFPATNSPGFPASTGVKLRPIWCRPPCPTGRARKALTSLTSLTAQRASWLLDTGAVEAP